MRLSWYVIWPKILSCEHRVLGSIFLGYIHFGSILQRYDPRTQLGSNPELNRGFILDIREIKLRSSRITVEHEFQSKIILVETKIREAYFFGSRPPAHPFWGARKSPFFFWTGDIKPNSKSFFRATCRHTTHIQMHTYTKKHEHLHTLLGWKLRVRASMRTVAMETRTFSMRSLRTVHT